MATPTPPKSVLEPAGLYPLFKANQLLSDGQLNSLGDALDRQTRLTRVCLVGVGILCGLVPRWKDDHIEISSGVGVSSDGYLLRLDTGTLAHYVEKSVAEGGFFDLAKPGAKTYQVLELFEQAPQDEPSKPLSGSVAAGKVLALALDYDEPENKQDCGDDCDEKGIERTLTVRKLLLDPDDARAIARRGYNPDGERHEGWGLDDLLIGRYRQAELYLERFGCAGLDPEAGPNATGPLDIRDHPTLLRRYSDMIGRAAERIRDALADAHKLLSPLFLADAPEPLPPLPTQRFKAERLEGDDRLEVQYVYSHLADLILAYEELADAAFDAMEICCDTADWFPTHLLLGVPLPDGAALPIPPSPLRTPYAQPAAYNGNRARAEAARLLFERLRRLIHGYGLPDERPIRIVPSRWGDAPLGTRAIPHYYKPQAELFRVWSPEQQRRGRERGVCGYHPVPDADPPFDEPLRYAFEGRDFFRIEGHVGRDRGEAARRILGLRQTCNLAFDLVAVKLGEQVNETDFDHDCEFRLLQAQYAKLRTDLLCALQHIDQTGDVEILSDELPEALEHFVYASSNAEEMTFERAFDAVVSSIQQEGSCLLGYDKAAFQELDNLRKTRRDEVLSQTLLHEFARLHPGLEHRGGVPRGGTFVLVYTEERAQLSEGDQQLLTALMAAQDAKRNPRIAERRAAIAAIEGQVIERLFATFDGDGAGVALTTLRQTVVADFCLPYLCCADCPPTAYVVTRPRPTLLIQPMAFCANDDAKHYFTVDPPGGLLTGQGTGRDPQGDYFVPSDAHIDAGNVEIRYSVDGAEATIQLRILPVPKADFQQLSSPLCRGKRIHLKPLPATPASGSFTTDIDPNDDQVGLVEEGGSTFFYADDPRVPTDTEIQIGYRVDSGDGCVAESHQLIRVADLPNADFDGLRETYCNDDERTALLPDDPSLTSRFTGNGIIDSDFVPDAVQFEGSDVTIDVTHVVTAANGCENTLTKSTTVFKRPDRADFDRLPAVLCRGGRIPLRPLPGTPPDGRFSTDIAPEDDQVGLARENGMVVLDTGNDRVPTNTDIRIGYRVRGDGGCARESHQTIRVADRPDAGFSGLLAAYCRDDEPTVLIPNDPTLNSTFRGDSGVREMEDNDPVRYAFVPETVGFETERITIQVTHEVEDTNGCIASLVKQTTVYARPGRTSFRFDDNLDVDGNELIVPIIGIFPPQTDTGAFEYIFSWRDSDGQEIQEPPRTTSEDFDLRIPLGSLGLLGSLGSLGQELELSMVVSNGPCEGDPMQVLIPLPVADNEPVDDDSPAPDTEPDGASVELEKRNIDRRRTRLAELFEADSGLADDKVAPARMFELLRVAAEGKTNETVEIFRDLAPILVDEYGRLRSDTRKTAYREMAEIAAMTLADRIALSSPSALDVASERMQGLGAVDMDIAALATSWREGDLAKTLDAERVERVMKLFG